MEKFTFQPAWLLRSELDPFFLSQCEFDLSTPLWDKHKWSEGVQENYNEKKKKMQALPQEKQKKVVKFSDPPLLQRFLVHPLP